MQEFLTHPVIAVVFLLSLLVFVHEFGHYIVGKMAGIGVETFSIGMGPRLFGFRNRGTDYRISALPLGGYVKFKGAIANEDVPEGVEGIELVKASLPVRAMVSFAGPLANVVLAMVVYFTLGLSGIKHPAAIVGKVRPGSPAEKAGLLPNDKIVGIGSEDIKSWREMQEAVSKSPGSALEFRIERSGEVILKNIVPDAVETRDMKGRSAQAGQIGIGYGFQPSVLTIMGRDSSAAMAGLKTGDRVARVEFSEQIVEIKNWPDLAYALYDASSLKLDSLTFKVISGGSPDAEKSSDQVEREVQISLAPWQGLSQEDITSRFQTGYALGAALGIVESALTVYQEDKTIPNDVGLQTNDRLLAFAGTPLKDIYHLQDLLEKNNEPKVTFIVLRNFEEREVQVDLKPIDVQEPSGRRTIYTLPVAFWGSTIEPEPYVERYDGILEAAWFGIRTAIIQCGAIVGTLAGLITGDVPVQALGGPMLIAKVAGDSAKAGWQTFITSMALISINLGVINLFPIPALDGGQLVMIGVQGLRRKPWSEVAIENYQKIGFVMVMALVVLATYNDLSRFWKSILQGVVGAFG